MCDSHKLDHSNKLLVFQYTKIIWETSKAFHLMIHDTNAWLPKSYVTIVRKHEYVTIPVWMAAKRGLIITHDQKKLCTSYNPKTHKRMNLYMFEWSRKYPAPTIDFRIK